MTEMTHPDLFQKPPIGPILRGFFRKEDIRHFRHTAAGGTPRHVPWRYTMYLKRDLFQRGIEHAA